MEAPRAVEAHDSECQSCTEQNRRSVVKCRRHSDSTSGCLETIFPHGDVEKGVAEAL